MSLIFSLTKHLLSTFTGPRTRIAVNQHRLCLYLPTLLFFHVPTVPSFIFRALNSHYGRELYCIVKLTKEKKKEVKEKEEMEEMEKMGKEKNGKEERKEGRKEGRREKGRKEERKEDY